MKGFVFLWIVSILTVVSKPVFSQSWVDAVDRHGRDVYMPANQYKWDWGQATFLNALIHLYHSSAEGQKKIYLDYIRQAMDATYAVANGKHPNAVASGHGMAFLARITGDKKYLDKCKEIYADYLKIPRASNGGVSHRAETIELWDDTVYMLNMFLLEMYRLTGDEKYIADFVAQFNAHHEKLSDAKSGLWVHGWDADNINYDDGCSILGWPDKLTRKSSEIWGRGNGWVGMALSDALNAIPKKSKYREPLRKAFIHYVEAVAPLQNQESGHWYQLMTLPAEPKNFLESSATAMFAYTITMGLKMGILDPKKYGPVAERSYNGIIKNSLRDAGNGYQVPSRVSGGTCVGDENYYMGRKITEGTGFGYGAFIMFGLAYEQYKGLRRVDVYAQSGDWKHLFDGKTLQGWNQMNGKAKYEVLDGAIKGTTVTGEPNSFLVTNEEYGDFILELELKVGDMNSGIQFRSLPDAGINGKVRGYQAEIDPSDRAWSGGIFDEGRRGWMYQTEMNPTAKKAFVKNGWNRYRIEAIGPVIRTWVNDIPVAYLVDDLTLKGFIALQVHGVKMRAGGASVQWRNIKIQTGAAMRPRALDLSVPVANYTLNTISPLEQAQGFSLLFNGKDLTGWRAVLKQIPPAKGWEVTDGILQIMPADSNGKTKFGDLLSVKQYKAFELNFEFKLTEGANSGVKYFVTESSDSERAGLGLEYQILDDERHPDAKLGRAGNRTMSSLYDLIPANKLDPRFQKKIGEWNQGKIIVYPNNLVQHWLNGFKVLEYKRGADAYKVAVAHSKFAGRKDFGLAEQGPVLLQDHGNAVYYKNIKIRVLTD